MHMNGVNQSHNGVEGCIQGDVYTVNSHLTCGVRDSDKQEVLHQLMERREEAKQLWHATQWHVQSNTYQRT